MPAYQRIRSGSLQRGADIYPIYGDILAAKNSCYPDEMEVNEKGRCFLEGATTLENLCTLSHKILQTSLKIFGKSLKIFENLWKILHPVYAKNWSCGPLVFNNTLANKVRSWRERFHSANGVKDAYIFTAPSVEKIVCRQPVYPM